MNKKLCVSIIIAFYVLFFQACGKGDTVVNTEYVPTAIPAVAPSEQDAINAVLNEENSYRYGLGQALFTSGLSCTLYTITGGQYIQNDATHSPTLTGVTQVATFPFADVFNQPDSNANDGLNVLPAALKNNPAYKNLIKLICQGQLAVTTTGYYQWDLTSDDGSVLYLDGSRLIDNDGGHSSTLKSGSKYLRRGIHAFRLDFAQTGAGNQSLMLQSNGNFIPGAYYYH